MYSGFTHYKYYGAYFYNREAERFNFLKVPEILVDREEFRGLSAEAIILYSILLKRTGMSFKNNWIDKEGRVFIYFTVEEIMKRRNISKPTAIKTLDELDVKKGIGLIERVRLGLGKPNIIYVKDFMSIFQVKENDLQKSKNLTSEVKDFNLRSKENELQEVKNLDSNYIPNHSYLSQLDVTYKTPDLMSHFLPPHEVSFTFCCS
ncbi:replication initiator protein A, partial [Streptococcus pneumoniae]